MDQLKETISLPTLSCVEPANPLGETLSSLSQCLLQLEDGSVAPNALGTAGREVSLIAVAATRAGRSDVAEICEFGEQFLSELANGTRAATPQIIDALLEMCHTLATLADLDESVIGQHGINVATLAEKLRAVSREPLTVQSSSALPASASIGAWPPPGVDFDPELIAQFKVESMESLQMLDADLLGFERTPSEANFVNAIFRVVHNIKGAADLVGLAQIKTLSHRLEDLLDLLRAGRNETTVTINDLVFRTVDELKVMIASVTSAGEKNRDLTDLLAALVAANQSAKTSQAPDYLAHDSEEDLAVYVDSAEQQLECIAAYIIKLTHGDASDATLATLHRATTTLLAAAAYLKRPELVESGREFLQIVQALRDGRKQMHESLAALPVGPPAGQLQTFEHCSVINCCETILQGEFSEGVLKTLRGSLTAILETATPSGSMDSTGAAAILLSTVDAYTQTRTQSLTQVRRLQTAEELRDESSCDPLRQVPASNQLELPESDATAEPTSMSSSRTAASKTGERSNSPSTGPAAANKTMRVDQGKLEEYINLAGELVIARNALIHEFEQFSLDASNHQRLKESVERVKRIVADVQINAMSMRMVPVQSVFQRFPRMVRDIAKTQGKLIEIQMFGEDTELDKQVAEKLADPLVHLIRNSADHGIELPEARREAGKSESGLITLKAGREGNSIIIDIIDDGGGIDVARLKSKAVEKGILRQEQADAISREKALELIFSAGLSTAKVVSDISGRGVGMDVVRSNIIDLGGTITVHSEEGKGSQLRLHLPLTLAVTTVVLVSARDSLYAIPMESIRETVKVTPEAVITLNGRQVISLRNQIVPIVSLADVLSSPRQRRRTSENKPIGLTTDRSGRVPIVVVATSAEVYGISVDELRGQQEIVMKPLPSQLGQVPGVGGATITGDGAVVLILDPAALSNMVISQTRAGTRQLQDT